MQYKEEQQFDVEIMQLNSKGTLPVRLTRNRENKVVKIEIYVNQEERGNIFNHFPDKNISWKESAAHLLVLKSVASYKKHQLTHSPKSLAPADAQAETQQLASLTPDNLANLLKELCHITAPLYALVNSPYLDSSYHPSHESWKNFCANHPKKNRINLTVLFLKQQLENYNAAMQGVFSKYDQYEKNPSLQALQAHHQKNTQVFKEQLEQFSKCVFTKNQLHKLFSHQNENDRLEIHSLGEFLRAESHLLIENAIPLLDEITEARFNQLFALSAHPLRRELVKAKSALEKQRSTHAVRFINTSAPIPEGQHAILADNKLPSKKRWLDMMPYINCKTLLDGGVDGAEGLDDIDQILCVYANGKNKTTLKKPYAEPYKTAYEMITGKKGALGIFGILIFGLPVAIFCAVGLLVGMLAATLIDLVAFALQASVIVLCLPIILFALAVDFVLQIPSFFTEKAEIKFSLLEKIARWPIPPKWLKEIFRNFSLVRMFKQFLLEGHCFYKFDDKIEQYKTPILEAIKKDEAEGVFNVVARKYFTISMVAGFLHHKLKQLFYALREVRKVFGLGLKRLMYLLSGGAKKVHIEECNTLTEQLILQVKERIQSVITDKLTAFSAASTQTHPNPYNSLLWPSLIAWKSREYETPIDFISDIGRVLAHELVDPAFENNPGFATPAFVASLLCSGTLLFPSMANVIPDQIVKGFQFIPQYIAKAFMGKELETGLSDFAINIISAFLQWKLSYFGMEGMSAIYHGDIEWVKKIFENPEEITLGAITFIAIGYGAGLIPQIPTDLSIFNQYHSENPFLKAVNHYLETIYRGFVSTLNTVTNESREVAHEAVFGVNSAELAFIGLKASMLVYGLISGNHGVEVNPLNIDIQKLCDDFLAASPNPFDPKTSETEKNAIIRKLLQQHHIPDTESTIAQFLLRKIETINQVALCVSPVVLIKNTNASEVKTSEKSIEEVPLYPEREKILSLLNLVHDMEFLGMPVYVGTDDEAVGYQSKVDAELLYDALYFAIENYNRAAQKQGLFHQQIEGHNLLHQFYNKHCYAGSSGWHKLLFGLLLFPMTWLWRGFKYLIGTPSMRHQVKKSFSKDLAMLFQLIPDVIAPILRTFLKASLYAIRMFLGILVLPFLIIACIFILTHSIATAIFAIPRSFRAIYDAIQTDDAKTFSKEMKGYFHWIKTNNKTIWDACLCNDFINGYMKLVSLIGSASGTGSLHRLSLLKATGIATYYQTLAQEADTNSENLQIIVRDLIIDLEQTKEQASKDSESYKQMREVLLTYHQKTKKDCKITSSERIEQLQWLSESIWASETLGKKAMSELEKDLPEGSRLKNELQKVCVGLGWGTH
jgi:hypothetical protein